MIAAGNAVQIGTVTVREPRKETIHSEYAAWWTDVELVPGVYPVTINDRGDLTARIPAIIVHEENASHFGGVAVGGSTQRRTGQQTDWFWRSAAYVVGQQIVEGQGSGDLTLNPEIEARRIDFERWQSCGEVVKAEKQPDGSWTWPHDHYQLWIDGSVRHWTPDKGWQYQTLLRQTVAEKDDAYRQTQACPLSGMVPCHTHGLFVGDEQLGR